MRAEGSARTLKRTLSRKRHELVAEILESSRRQGVPLSQTQVLKLLGELDPEPESARPLPSRSSLGRYMRQHFPAYLAWAKGEVE